MLCYICTLNLCHIEINKASNNFGGNMLSFYLYIIWDSPPPNSDGQKSWSLSSSHGRWSHRWAWEKAAQGQEEGREEGRRVNQRIKQCSDDSGCWRGLAGWTTAGLQQNPSHSGASLRLVHSSTIEESLHWKLKNLCSTPHEFCKDSK